MQNDIIVKRPPDSEQQDQLPAPEVSTDTVSDESVVLPDTPTIVPTKIGKTRRPLGVIIMAIIVCLVLISVAVYVGWRANSHQTESQPSSMQSTIGVDNTNPAQLADDVSNSISNDSVTLPDMSADLSDAALGL